MDRRWYHQDGNTRVGHSRLQSASQEGQLETIHRQYNIVKNPEPGGEAEAPVWATETGKDNITRVRGLATLDCIAYTLGWHISTLCRPPWAYSFYSGKRELKFHIEHPQCCKMLPGRPTGVRLHGNR